MWHRVASNAGAAVPLGAPPAARRPLPEMLILLPRRPRPFCCLLKDDDVMAVATTSLKMMMIDLMRFNELPARPGSRWRNWLQRNRSQHREKTSLWATPNTKQEVRGDCGISSVCDTFDRKKVAPPAKSREKC